MTSTDRTTLTTAPDATEAAMLDELVELALALHGDLQALISATGKREFHVSIPVSDATDAARLPLLYLILKLVGISARPRHGSTSDVHNLILEDGIGAATGASGRD